MKKPSFLLATALAALLLLMLFPPGLWLAGQGGCWLLIPGLTLLLLAVAIRIGLWNASGGPIEILRGQIEPSPRLLKPDICLIGEWGPPHEAALHIDLSRPIHEISPRFLSFSLDMSQVVGGKWWDPRAEHVELGSGSVSAPLFNFDRPELDTLVQALAPAFLRLGGSESDKVYYDLPEADPLPPKPRQMESARQGRATAPAGYESVLTSAQWDAANRFAQRNGLEMIFTLNAGPSARDRQGNWRPQNAARLLAYSAAQGYPVSAWELGNEMNVFWALYGLKAHVPVSQYHQDLIAAQDLIKGIAPEACLAAQGSAFWPILGETLSLFFGYMPASLKRSGDLIDIVTWHYYPQQSRRGPAAVRRAHPSRLLRPKNLDEAAHWADMILAWRDQYAPHKPVWLGETGNAQFGGEPGLSDVYLSGLWWLDQLGLMAQHGQDLVVRQTLCGGDYGMIEEERLAPRPDYWNSLLWKRLMGERIYALETVAGHVPQLRSYAHASLAGENPRLTVLAINLDPRRSILLSLPQFHGRPFDLYQVTSPDLFSTTVLLNGQPMVPKSGRLPEIRGLHQQASPLPGVTLPPLSYAFLAFDSAPGVL